ncbi:MAG: hypothetical protein K6G82_03170 [Ruminococcus sp.]|nr:hypothetical protein [Ruminococcus sp.]
MKEGFFVNGAHTFGTYGLRCIKRNIGEPQKDDYTERVPFSNLVYDFGGIYGEQTYGERRLSYTLEFMCFNRKIAESKIINIKKWLHWTGSETFNDDLMPDYHFKAREPSFSWSESHGVYTISVSFPAAPEMWANVNEAIPTKYVFPDVNGDGKVNAIDASMILAAYSAISTGQDPGLTEEQLDACDANRDGRIDARDASLVLEFYSLVSVGRYDGSPASWTEYMNDKKSGGI